MVERSEFDLSPTDCCILKDVPRDNQRLKTVYPFLRRRPRPETVAADCNCADAVTTDVAPASLYTMQSELAILPVAGLTVVARSDFVFFQFSTTTVRNA